MNQSQDATNISDIREQIARFRVIINRLQELEDYYTKAEIDQKTSEINNTTSLLNGSVSAMSRQLAGLETNLSNILATVQRLDAIDHSQFLTEVDMSAYATKDDVTEQIQDVANEELDGRVSQLESDIENVYSKSEVDNKFVEQQNLESSVSTAGFLKADANTITNLTSRIVTLENTPDIVYDDTEVRTLISGLGTRISTLEAFPHLDYITTEDVPGKTGEV